MMTSWEPSGSIQEKKNETERGYFAHSSRHERLNIHDELLGIIWEHEIIIIKNRKDEGEFFSVWGQVHSIWV
jgi:hypothetical protein